MRVIVLGWDALDAELLDKYGVDGFGAHRRRIETHVNPVIDEPHTLELWPSLITGLPPDAHGVHAVTKGDGVNWDSSTLRLLATLSEGVVPDRIKTYIGAKLQERGVSQAVTDAEYYRRNDVATVFDDQPSQAISIPNYETQRDRALGLDAHRDSLWAAIDADKTGFGVTPGVDTQALYAELGDRFGARMGATLAALPTDAALIWTWFGVLDSVGHIAPALDDHIVADWYDVAGRATQTLREQTAEETIVIAVSDHGLQDGSHTHYATICCDKKWVLKGIDHVFDLAWTLRAMELDAPSRGRQTDGDLRSVHEELEAMGYI